MPPRYLATVTCPSCGTRFQTPVQQVLDVRVDADAASRVLSGGVNVAVCPSCGTGGALNLPFIYHDPEKEIALLYLPVESGPGMVERQKVAGRLTRQLMDAMAPEERKGYLLQPETFISMEIIAALSQLQAEFHVSDSVRGHEKLDAPQPWQQVLGSITGPHTLVSSETLPNPVNDFVEKGARAASGIKYLNLMVLLLS